MGLTRVEYKEDELSRDMMTTSKGTRPCKEAEVVARSQMTNIFVCIANILGLIIILCLFTGEFMEYIFALYWL